MTYKAYHNTSKCCKIGLQDVQIWSQDDKTFGMNRIWEGPNSEAFDLALETSRAQNNSKNLNAANKRKMTFPNHS